MIYTGSDFRRVSNPVRLLVWFRARGRWQVKEKNHCFPRKKISTEGNRKKASTTSKKCFFRFWYYLQSHMSGIGQSVQQKKLLKRSKIKEEKWIFINMTEPTVWKKFDICTKLDIIEKIPSSVWLIDFTLILKRYCILFSLKNEEKLRKKAFQLCYFLSWYVVVVIPLVYLVPSQVKVIQGRVPVDYSFNHLPCIKSLF